MQIGLGNRFRNTSLGRYSKEGCELAYVPIHKNAHTWAVEFFSVNYGFERITDLTIDRQNALRYVVFLRDPITRWYSGAAQYLTDNFWKGVWHDEGATIDEKLIITMLSAVRVDAHTDLQRNYISDLNIMDVYFFNTDESMFYYKFTKWLNTVGTNFKLEKIDNGSDNHTLIERNNTTSESRLKTKLVKILKDYVDNNPKYLINLKNYYLPDYQLLEYMYKFSYARSN